MGRPRSLLAQSGFTLVELLMVMVIIGLLAAIVIPMFFNQREKASDAAAKSTARGAETAIEAYATNEESYEGADPAALHAIDPTVPAGMPLAIGPTTNRTYELSVESRSGSLFRIERLASGVMDFQCAPAGTGGCDADGRWD